MQQRNLKANTPKSFKLTTYSKHSLPVAPNILDRQFDVQTPYTVWTADISYVWTYEGWLYLAIVMDLFSSQIVGWVMNSRVKKQLVLDALAMWYWQRNPPKSLLHHSDRGSQYARNEYQNQLKFYGMTASMSRKGHCRNNAPTDRFFPSLISEKLTACLFITRNKTKNEILDNITF